MRTIQGKTTKGAAGRRPRTAGSDGDTRAAILAAARSVFARRGYEGASTREVAEIARVNNAMIYYHFRDKRRLYRAVLAQAFSEFDRIWEHPVFSSKTTSRRKIQTYIEGFIRFQQANDEVRRIMTMEFASCRDNYQWLADAHFSHSYDRLAGLLREATRSGDLRRVDPSLAISCLVGAVIHSFIMRPIARHIIGKQLDLGVKRFGRFVTDLLFEGLGSHAVTAARSTK
jgi:AcrR family transcriptional regulator